MGTRRVQLLSGAVVVARADLTASVRSLLAVQRSSAPGLRQPKVQKARLHSGLVAVLIALTGSALAWPTARQPLASVMVSVSSVTVLSGWPTRRSPVALTLLDRLMAAP